MHSNKALTLVLLAFGGCGLSFSNGLYAQTVGNDGAAEARAEDVITVTATRQETSILDAPASVSVINREEIEEHMTRDVQDLVRYEPGVFVNRQTSGADPFGNLAGFNIRGVGGNRVQIQVDRTRIIERVTDGNRNFVDLPFIAGVEILRGPGSVLWGSDALGGVVAFRTLDPSDLLRTPDKNVVSRLSTSFDSFDRSFVKTGISAFRISPTLEGIVGLSHKSASEGRLRKARADGGYWGCPVPTARFLPCNKLNPLDVDVWNAFAKFVWTPSADHKFKLTGEYFSSDSTANQLWNYGVVSGGIRNDENVRNQLQTRGRISLEHEWKVGAPWIDDLRWQVSYSPQQRTFTTNNMQTILAGNQPRRTRGHLDYREDFLQADIQAKSSLATGPLFHTLTWGFQGDVTWTDYSKRDVVTNLATGTTTTTIAGGFNFANATTMRYDFYIQDEISLLGDRLKLTPGVRLANYSIDPRVGAGYVSTPGAEPRQINSTRVIPQVGAIYKIDDVYSLYGRYAEGFKMPTAEQLYTSLPGSTFVLVPNPDLKPESVRSYEGGVRGKFAQGWFSFGAFHADYTDFIQSLQNIPGTVNYTSINLSSVRITGIEASAEWRWNERWSSNLSVAYQYATQRTTPNARETAFDNVPPFTAVLGLKHYMPEHRLEAELVATVAAGVNRSSRPTLFRASGYDVLDAYLNWRPIDSVVVRAGVQNIFDRRYFANVFGYDKVGSCTSTGSCVRATNPLELQVAPGRTFKLAAQVEF